MQKILFTLILAIFLIHTFGLYYNWYYVYSWMDIPMHIAGGAFIALFAIYVFEDKLKVFRFREHPWFSALAVIGIVMLVGVVWEWYEYLSEVFIQHKVAFTCAEPGSLFDTLKDLMDDLIGGTLAASLVGVFRKK